MNTLLDRLDALGANTATALARFMDDLDMYEMFLKMFPEEKCVKQLAEAVAAGDAESAQFAAHTLKGVSGNLGLDPVMTLSSDMVKKLRAGEVKAAMALWPELDRLCREFSAVITA